MKPYYEHAGITIYHGDCRDVFFLAVTMAQTVFITDPPYGIDLGLSDSRGDGHGLAKHGYESDYRDTFSEWCQLVPVVLEHCVTTFSRGCAFTGKHLTYFPPPSVVGGVYVPSGVGRNQWGFTNFMPVFFYGIQPTLQKGAQQTVLRSMETSPVNGHPCPKPEGWMRWLVNLASLPNETIFDPFMGSGTTLSAAKRLNRRGIGIELEERYCEIAAKRLAQEALPLEP